MFLLANYGGSVEDITKQYILDITRCLLERKWKMIELELFWGLIKIRKISNIKGLIITR